MRQAGWRRALTVVAVAAVMTATGCVGGDPGHEPTATEVSASTTPIPSPSPTVDLTKLPEKPAAMSEPTTDGAIAAATYVLQLFPYTYATRDVGPWRVMTAETCVYCTGVVTDVEGIVSEDHEVIGGAVAVKSASSVEITEDEWFSVDMVITQEPSRRLGGGGIVSESPGGEFEVLLEMSWDNGWRVDEMGIRRLEGSR